MTKRHHSNEFDTSAPAVPERVSVAMNEIATDMRGGLLALAVGAGLQVVTQLTEADVAAVCVPRGSHDPERAAIRHGTERGSVTLGGRRVPVTRPRVRAADGTREVPVATYELFISTELLGRMAMEGVLAASRRAATRPCWNRFWARRAPLTATGVEHISGHMGGLGRWTRRR